MAHVEDATAKLRMSASGDEKGEEDGPKFGLDFHARVEEISHKKYESLPRRGKPERGEWTPLATIVQATYGRIGYGVAACLAQVTNKMSDMLCCFRNGSCCSGYWLKVYWTTKDVT